MIVLLYHYKVCAAPRITDSLDNALRILLVRLAPSIDTEFIFARSECSGGRSSALFVKNRGQLPIPLPRSARLCRANHPTKLGRLIHLVNPFQIPLLDLSQQ